MIRGTTPTLLFRLPFSASQIKAAEITIKYVDNLKKEIMVKTLEDCTVEEKSISIMLTQEETLRFPAQTSVAVQLRVLTNDDVALATEPQYVKVKKLLSGDVIE